MIQEQMVSGFLGHKLRIHYDTDDRTAIGRAIALKGNALLVQITDGPLITTSAAQAVTFANGVRLFMHAAVFAEMSGRIIMGPIGEVHSQAIPGDLTVVTKVVKGTITLGAREINLEILAGGNDALYFESRARLTFEGKVPLRIEAGGASLDVKAEILSQGVDDENFCGVLGLEFANRISPARWKTMCS